MRNFIILASLLAALIGLSITLFWQVEQSGFSAISALLVILNLVCAAQIFNLFKRQTRRADMVFRALAIHCSFSCVLKPKESQLIALQTDCETACLPITRMSIALNLSWVYLGSGSRRNSQSDLCSP